MCIRDSASPGTQGELRADRAGADRALPASVFHPLRLSRWYRRLRAHRRGLLRQLPQVREAARAECRQQRHGRRRMSVPMRVLVTGGAGFIGMHAALALAAQGADVVALDSFDPYYDVELKQARAWKLARAARIEFRRHDLAQAEATAALFTEGKFTHVVHLAAPPGVRYSLSNPAAYLRNNIDAFGNVLEGCRHAQVSHLVYASSSSVYGGNHVLPFSEDQPTDTPVLSLIHISEPTRQAE